MATAARVKPWNSVSVRIVACGGLLMAAALGLALLMVQESQRHHEFLLSFRNRDLSARTAAFEMQAAVESISFRTMGILAEAYRAPGSVAFLDNALKTLTDNWNAIRAHEFLPKERETAIDARVSAVVAFGDTMRTSYKENAGISRVYDSWLDVAAPLRKDARSIVAELDSDIERRLDGVTEEAVQNRSLSRVAICGVLFIAVVAGWLVVSGLVLPVSRLTRAMNEITAGNVDSDIPGRRQRDEFWLMTEALRGFRAGSIRIRQLTAEQAEMESRAQAERQALTASLVARFETDVLGVVDALAQSAAAMRAMIESLSAAIDETRQNASVVASAAGQVSANVQAAASGTDSVSAAIDEISRRMAKASDITRGATEQGETTKVSVEELAEAAKQIDAVLDLINGIARQTSLLALNASIEAARAGNAGRGFAIVATEVKALASQTASAIEDISGYVDGVRSGVAGAMHAIDAFVNTIHGIDEIAKATTRTVEQQQAATQTIARSVNVAARDSVGVSQAISAVSSGTDYSNQEASGVLKAMAGLVDQSEALRGIVRQFVSEMRAA